MGIDNGWSTLIDRLGSFGSDTKLIQALGLGLAWKYRSMMVVLNHLSTNNMIGLRRDDK